MCCTVGQTNVYPPLALHCTLKRKFLSDTPFYGHFVDTITSGLKMWDRFIAFVSVDNCYKISNCNMWLKLTFVTNLQRIPESQILLSFRYSRGSPDDDHRKWETYLLLDLVSDRHSSYWRSSFANCAYPIDCCRVRSCIPLSSFQVLLLKANLGLELFVYFRTFDLYVCRRHTKILCTCLVCLQKWGVLFHGLT